MKTQMSTDKSRPCAQERDKKHRLAQIILLVSGLWLLSTGFIGCAGIQRKDLSKEKPLLETAAFLKFSDVPVPTGLKFLSENSYLVESGLIRTGLLKYTGKAAGDQVVNFYKEQMPMFGWRLLNLVEYGDKILNFEKEKETCIITVQPKGSKSDITISIAPKSSPIEKRKERPIK